MNKDELEQQIKYYINVMIMDLNRLTASPDLMAHMATIQTNMLNISATTVRVSYLAGQRQVYDN